MERRAVLAGIGAAATPSALFASPKASARATSGLAFPRIATTSLSSDALVSLASTLARNLRVTAFLDCFGCSLRPDLVVPTVVHEAYPHTLGRHGLIDDVLLPPPIENGGPGHAPQRPAGLPLKAISSLAEIARTIDELKQSECLVLLSHAASVGRDLPRFSTLIIESGGSGLIERAEPVGSAQLLAAHLRFGSRSGARHQVFASDGFDRRGRYDPVRIVRTEHYLLRHFIARPSGDPAEPAFDMTRFARGLASDVTFDPAFERERSELSDVLQEWRRLALDPWPIEVAGTLMWSNAA